MRYEILFSILFELLKERRLTAGYLAQKYALSPRTIYRYVRKLATFIPLEIVQGRSGGITLADKYLLPVGFLTREEFSACEEALAWAYAKTEQEVFLSARRKLSAAKKAPYPAD